MTADPIIHTFVMIVLAILLLSILITKLRQPLVVAYLIVGIILGPHVLGIVDDYALLSQLGSIGVVLLLFFAGMELSPQRLLANWRIAVIGTFLQIIVSIAVIAILDIFIDWPLERVILFGFVISLSSTSVVLNLLESWREIGTRVGQNVVGILLVQDLAVIPMLIILGVASGETPALETVALQMIGGIGIVTLTIWLTVAKQFNLPFLKWLNDNHDMQVFAALTLCFGMALLTGIFQLSEALGAFIAGMLVSSAEETHWIRQRLLSLRTVFIALFFVSIGMLIDLHFVLQYWWQFLSLVLAIFIINTVINSGILRALGETWHVSLYGGSLLSQIGEFSFVIALVGYQIGIIEQGSYQMIITMIALSLLLSPLWISLVRNSKRFSRLTN